MEVEGDVKVTKALLDEWTMEKCSGVNTPGMKEEELEEVEDPLLSEGEKAKYRRAAARCNYIGMDRPDLAYAAKEISRRVSEPRMSDIMKLKRLIRYLQSYRRLVQKFRCQADREALTVMVDSDWTGCRRTR